MRLSTLWLLAMFTLVPVSVSALEASVISEQLKTRYQASSVRISSNEKEEPEGLFNISGPIKMTSASQGQSLMAGAPTQRDSALANATQFLSENTDFFSAKESNFLLKRRNTDKFGAQHFRFLRTIEGIPVADMEVIVHVAPDNSITGVNGNIVRPDQLLTDHMTQVDTNKLLDKAKAFTVVSALHGEDTQSLRLLNADLLLFNSAPHIRWHLDFNSSAQVGRYSYWINAETGELIDVKNTLHHPIPLIR